MDGGRRLLRSLKGTLPCQPFARPAFAGLQDDARSNPRGAELSAYSAFAPRRMAAERRRPGFVRSTVLGDLTGQVFSLFILTVAAAEAAIGLAILVTYYRNRGSIAVEDINMMKG